MAAATGVVRFDVAPTGGILGAEVSGVDLSAPLDPELVAGLRKAWLKHQVLVFREQNLTDAQLVAVARAFGEPHIVEPTLEYDRAGLLPEIDVVSNVVENGKQIGTAGAGELHWHSDMSVYDVPASGTFLFGKEIPPVGGSTRFANLYAAYETLPQALKDKVEGRRSIHDIAYTAYGTLRGGYQEVNDKSKGPGAVHPVVRTHPETGRKALFLGRQGYGYIHGYPVAESDELLDQLWQHMTKPQFVWEHVWQQGDVIVWDNRCLIHSRGSFPSNTRRMLRRVTVKGEKPA
jgi:taurine dioxygenase